MKERLKNTIMFTITMSLFLILAESGFRFYSDISPIYDIEMYKYAKKLQQRSETPGLTHEHITNSEAKLMRVNIAINSSGFRDKFIPRKKEKNDFRILVAGSSITMGWGVPYDSVFTSLLENELNKYRDNMNYEVINTSIGNYNTNMAAILLEKNLPLVDPDKVILHFFLNDVESLSARTTNIFIKYSYLAAYLNLKLKRTIFNTTSSYNSIGEYYLGMYKNSNKGWIDAQNSIIKMSNLCKSNNFEFMVLIQPDLHDLSFDSNQYKCHSIIKDFLDDNNIIYLDLFNTFSMELKDEPRNIWVNPDDQHPNAKGHRIIYKALNKFLLERNNFNE